MNSSNRFNRVQALRFFAAAAVALGHVLIFYSQKRPLDEGTVTIVNWLSGWSVSLFFCISGFVITQSAQSRTAGQFLAARMLRIYPGFWLAVLVQVLAGLALFGSVPSVLYSFHSLSLLPLGKGSYPLMIEWSLIYEVVFYLLFAVLWIRRSNVLLVVAMSLWLILIVSASLIGAGYDERYPIFPAVLMSLRNLPFIAGCMAYYIFSAPRIIRFRAYFLPLAIAGGLLTTCATTNLSILSLHAASSVLVLLAAVTADARNHISGDATLVKFGDASYGLYLIHITIINICLARGPFEQNLLGIPALFAIALGLGLGFGAIEQVMYRRLKMIVSTLPRRKPEVAISSP